MKKIAHLVLKSPFSIVALSVLLTVIGGIYSAKLYLNLRPDLEELLPQDAPSVVDLKEISGRLHSTEFLGILVFSENIQKSKTFVIDLATELSKYPRDVVAGVEYRIDEELRFFGERQSLFIELADLKAIRDYVDRRIEFESQLFNPLKIFDSIPVPEPFLDFISLERKYAAKAANFTRFPEGFYASADQKIRMIMVKLPGAGTGIGASLKLRAAVDEALTRIRPENYDPGINVRFSGGVQNLVEEHASLMEDLEVTFVVVLILTAFVLFYFYRSFWGPTLMLTSLIMGCAWTFGAAYAMVGYLNGNTAFLGAIVVGNGINFGIILLARYFEERRLGLDHDVSLERAMTETATATLTASLAAGLAYGSLSLTGFRGFNQFGKIGLVGMVACWISAYTTFPALLTLLHRYSPKTLTPRSLPTPYLSRAVAWAVTRFPRAIIALSVLLTVAASLSYLTLKEQDLFETNMSNLRDDKSIREGSSYLAQTYHPKIFGNDMTPFVVLLDSPAEAKAFIEKLNSERSQDPYLKSILEVYRLQDFVPEDQEEKIKVLHQIRHLLPERYLRRMPAQDRAKIENLLGPKNLVPFKESDLPSMIRERFQERDGTMGRLVFIQAEANEIVWQIDTIIGIVSGLRRISKSVNPEAALAGQLPVTGDLLFAIKRDGPRATAFAFLAVLILILILFRNLKSFLFTSTALFFGVAWMFGAIGPFDLKINFLNFIALPITFGIGVDYAVNIFQRYLIEGRGSIGRVLVQTGGAVGLASLTTIIGYGSLMLAGNRAFVSFGKLAVIGEVTCLLAAVFSLPAILVFLDRRREKSANTEIEHGVGATSANLGDGSKEKDLSPPSP